MTAPMSATLRRSMVWHPGETPLPASVAFRRTLNLLAVPVAASLCIFADARYMLWINGVYVARGPSRFDPKRPEYDTLDVARYLRAGANVVAVLVHASLSNYRFIKHTPGLGIALSAMVDGRSARFKTDSAWRSSATTRFAPPTVLISGIADEVDENRESADWVDPRFDDSHWPYVCRVAETEWGEFQPRQIPLLRETQVPEARIVSPNLEGRLLDGALPLTLQAPAVLLVDTGTMVRAGFELDFEPQGPALFELRPRQSYTNRDAGFLGRCRYRTSNRTGRRLYQTTDDFTCRLVQIELKEGALTLHGLRIIERRYPFDRVGRFRCSDPFFNALWEMALRTAEVNAVDGYIDGSEGGEWVTGHIDYPVSQVAFAAPGPDGKPVYSDPRLLANQLSRMALSQEGRNLLRAWHPTDWNLGPRDMGRGIHNYIEDSSCVWVSLLRTVYEATGDRGLVDRLWPTLETVMRWFVERRTVRGLVHAREFYLHFDNPIAYLECEGSTLNALVYRALADAAVLARRTGRTQRAVHFTRAASALATAYNRHLWSEEKGTYLAGLKEGEKKLLTQWPDPSFKRYFAAVNQSRPELPPTPQAALMALHAGLVPKERLSRVQNYVLARHGELLAPVSYLFAFESLYAMDTEVADREALDTMRRRWAIMVGRKMPGTLGEQFGDESYYCHDFGPIPAAFLADRVLGVRRVGEVGTRRIAIEPRLGDLQTAEGIVCTHHGPVEVAWSRRPSGGLVFTVVVPVGVTADLSVPAPPGAQLRIGGRTRATKVRGRFLTTTLRPGRHEGEVRP